MSFWMLTYVMQGWGNLDGGRAGVLLVEIALLLWLALAWWSVRRTRLAAETDVREAAALVDRAHTTAADGELVRAELRHDAANSFAGLRAALTLLRDGTMPPERLGSALVHELEHLEHLVMGVDDAETDFPIAELVDEAALLCAAQGVDVTVSSEAATAHGRPADVRRAVENLLANARRHGKGTVELAVRTAGTGVEVAVSDAGPGVPEALAERIFDRGTTTDAQQGSGLGLHVSRRLMRRQRGDLSLRQHGLGTTFAIRLPVGAGVNAAGREG